MKHLSTLLALLALLLPCSLRAASEEKENPIDAELEAAMEKNPSTSGMVHALGIARDKWDKEMNATYKKLKETMEAEDFRQLVAAQKAWLAYRDAQVEQIGNYFGKKEGTVNRVNAASLITDLTKSRALFLKSLLEGAEE